MTTTFSAAAYGPVIQTFIEPERVPPLGPGSPNKAMYDALRGATVDTLFAHARIVQHDMAAACLSGLWLYHDYLDESHTLSQDISSPTGSYWHGIMHRREPDFSNGKYWFRRVGHHPIFPALADAARALAADAQGLKRASWLADATSWDPFAFIDLCEACYSGKDADHALCRQVGLAEWRLLFDFSYRQAVGD